MMTPGPCAKQVVTATIVTPSGRRFIGTNHCLNAQSKCPRRDMPTGMGYELCRDICQQPGHAEIQALMNATMTQPNLHLHGSVLYLEGHTYVCESCLQALGAAGVLVIIFGAPPTLQ